MVLRTFKLAAFAAALLVGTGIANAFTATGTLTVQVNVQPGCAISGSALDFGTYTAGQASDLLASTVIEYSNCLAGQLTVEFDGGSSGTTTDRRMSNGDDDELSYALYSDAARTGNLGQGSEAKVIDLTTAGSGSFSIYGSIPGSQLVPAGTYTDTVNITITF